MKRYVDRYNICQRIKNRTEIPAEKLKLSEILEKLWTYLIVDFIIKLLLVSKIKVVDLIYFYFLFYFYFSFDLFFIFLFLELRVRVRVTKSCSHIR